MKMTLENAYRGYDPNGPMILQELLELDDLDSTTGKPLKPLRL